MKKIILILGLLFVSSNSYATTLSIFSDEGVYKNTTFTWDLTAIATPHYFNSNFVGTATLSVQDQGNDNFKGGYLGFSLVNNTDTSISVVDTYSFGGWLHNMTKLSPDFLYSKDRLFNLTSLFQGNGFDLRVGDTIDYFSHTRDLNYTHAQPAVSVPEPSTWIMALLGFAFLGYAWRTK